MKISAKIDYACRALLELSLQWPSSAPLQINEIAKRQGIPLKFLVHILISLKQHGVVKSIRGKNGGYVLVKAPKDIRLDDILSDFSGEKTTAPASNSEFRKANVMALIWHEIDE